MSAEPSSAWGSECWNRWNFNLEWTLDDNICCCCCCCCTLGAAASSPPLLTVTLSYRDSPPVLRLKTTAMFGHLHEFRATFNGWHSATYSPERESARRGEGRGWVKGSQRSVLKRVSRDGGVGRSAGLGGDLRKKKKASWVVSDGLQRTNLINCNVLLTF